MGESPRVKLRLRGISEVMTLRPVVEQVARRGNRIRAAAGDGFRMVLKVGPKYTVAYVGTEDARARRRQARDAVLQRALDAGRG